VVSLLWLLGREVHSVSAMTGNYFFKEHQDRDMEDFGQILLELDGGVTASILCGRTGWRSHPAGGLNRVYLAGAKSVATVDAHLPRAAVWSDAPSWTPPERDPEDPMGMWSPPGAERYAARPKRDWIFAESLNPGEDVEYFLDCIESGKESDVPAELAARAMEILLAAYRSAAEGRMVTLPLSR
jgi:predicted dehydrogenase